MSRPDRHIIEETKAFWSRKSGRRLSDDDAREILANVRSLFRLLVEWEKRERQEMLREEPQSES